MPTATGVNSYLSVLTRAERQTSLIGAWLGAQLLRGIDLSDCVLEKTHCDGTTFSEVNLRRANFRGASLRRAHFIRCDLTEAVFPGALVAGADFLDCHGLTANTIRVLCQRGARVLSTPPGAPPIGSPDGGAR
jgi:hypothetical protein